MNWTDTVKEIRKAQENNQLIIFVGAGVSKNSDIPTWWELIKTIADTINYDKCVSCKKRDEACPKSECEDRYAFTQDEFLRIPEYFFQRDTSENKTEYYELIRNTLKCDNDPNPIDDEIFNILPHHIITTNYDSLLENTTVLNSQLYTVVSQDSDLLSKASERYIIKMHGDLYTPSTIVLKESDYIDYEHKHTLISTFIRALLVNHTFMFLGYSLNDYNLNLIIGWINYFRKFYNVDERPSNFLVTPKAPSDFEKLRLEDKNIFVVDLDSLPDDLAEKASAPVSLSSSSGKRLYSFLRCITDSQILQHYVSLADILSEKYKVLKSYKKISFKDLIRVQPLGRTTFLSTELIFHDKEWYEHISKLLDEGNQELIDTFQRAGLTAIRFYSDDSSKIIPLLTKTSDVFFELYLNNKYVELLNQIQTCSDTAIKIYYYHLLGKSTFDIEKVIAEEVLSISQKDYVAILLHKMRTRIATITLFDRQDAKTKELEQLFDTIPVEYRCAIYHLKMLFESSAKDMLKMEKLVEKQEARYKYRSNATHFGHSFTHIWSIQSYVYDYYFYFKENGLPFDYFTDPKNYFSYYLRAVLCSYSPIAPVQQGVEFDISTDRRHYPLNEVDIDILIKYTTSKSLRSWIEEYSVQFLEIKNEIDIVRKFKNLCNCFVHFRISSWVDQILNFSIILCLLKLDNNSKKDILNALVSTFQKLTKDTPQAGEILFESVDYIIKHLRTEGVHEIKGSLLEAILAANVYPEIAKTHSSMLTSVIKKLAPYANAKTKKHLIEEVEVIEDKNKKISKIVLLRHILPIDQYIEFLNSNLEYITTVSIFNLLVEKILPYSEATLNRFVDVIISEDKKRKENPGVRTCQDWLMISIEECIILKLIGFNIDLALLEPYAHYSEHLQFMLNPSTFDYSSIDTSNYMWQNFIYCQDYKEHFIAHKNELLSDDLKNLFEMGVETKDQQKIVYGLLLDDDNLRGFGK